MLSHGRAAYQDISSHGMTTMLLFLSMGVQEGLIRAHTAH